MTATAVPDLPPRMRQVLDALHRGLTVADTARELHVDEGTVRAHRGRLYRRLGAHSSRGALARARALGLLP